MGAMKDRMMDIEELMTIALENGAQSLTDVASFVDPRTPDEMNFIVEQMKLLFGPMEAEMT